MKVNLSKIKIFFSLWARVKKLFVKTKSKKDSDADDIYPMW
jgi:hypothetical protein